MTLLEPEVAEPDLERTAWGPPCIIGGDRLRLRYQPFAPSPLQAAFLGLTCDDALFGGMVGGGKSLTLLLAALQFCDVPGYNALLLRRTLQDLKLADSLIPMSRWLLTGKGPTYNANDYIWTFPTDGAPATLQFGYLRNPGDELRYQGTQYQFVGFDEMTQFPDRDQVRYLRSRMRRLNLSRDEMIAVLGQSPDGLTLGDIPLRFRGATNPGGPGHAWVKADYVDPETAIAPFLRSSFRDNPGINDEEVRAMLAGLSEVERRRLELGDWDVVEVPGALWTFAGIGRAEPPFGEFDVVAMAVDGSVGEGTGDECGIVIGGFGQGVVTILEDASMRGHPDEWAKRAILQYHHWGCTRLVVETNQGGELNGMILNNAADALGLERPNIIGVRAKPGESKEIRAQPVAQAYRAGKVVHGPEVRDSGLEAQMASWIPGDKKSTHSKSPDRVDAMVWLVQHLLFRAGRTEVRSSARSKLGGKMPSAR